MGPKGRAKLARATKIREVVLRFMRKHGRWERLTNGPEVLMYEDEVLMIIVSIQEELPPKMRKQFNLGLLSQGLYQLQIWEKGTGKVLNLCWSSVGATPEIIAFRRGDWEEIFLAPPPSTPGFSPSQLGNEFAAQVRRRRRQAKIGD
jgi:hypothetical protein